MYETQSTIDGISSVPWRILEEAEYFKCVFIVYCVGQLYEDKSLALHARDLNIFTTDLQTVNYYTTIHRWS